MAETTNITWDGTPIDEFDRDSLNLQRINENGTVQQMIEIINANFEEIARHGGGPGGVDGKDGVDGVDGLNSEYIYSNECDVITSSDAGVKYPSSNSEYSDLFYRVNNSSSHYAYYKNVKWYDHPQGVSPEKPNEYVISRYRRSVDGEWYYSEVPTIWSHWGQTGRDGDGVEYIFMSSKRELSELELSSSILKISEMDDAQKALFNIDDFFPGSGWFVDGNIDKAKSALEKAGVDIGTDVFRTRWTNCFEFCDNGFEWTDDPIGTSVENPNEYVAIRRCNTDENTGEKIWGDYSKPALWSNYSFEGRVFIIYCNTGKDEEPVAPQKGQGRWNVTENTLDLTGLPSGWTDDNLDKEDDEITWMSSGIFNHNGDNVSWSKPVCISGKDGKDGEDGTNIQFIYALSELPDYPSTRAMQEELFDAVESATTNPKYSIYEYTKWFDRAQPISPTDRTEYMWARRRDKETDPWEYDPMPIIWAHWGEDGTDGDGVEYIFTTTDEYIEDDDVELSAELSLPKYEALNTEQKKLFQIDDFVPSKYWFEKKKNGVYSNKSKAEEALERTISDSEWQGCFGFNVYPGWTDNPISISPYEPYQWVSIRRSTADEFDGKRFWEDFSTPVLWNSYGKGTRVFVVYCNIDGNDTPKRPEGGYWYNLGGENKLVNSKEDYADYKCNALEDGTPDYSSYVGYWNDKNIDVDGTISWMSSGVFTEDGENISWSEPFRITGPAGMNGMDGSNETYVYALSDVEPVCPINGTYQEKLDFFTNVENADPEEWTENPNGYTYTDPVTQKTTVWYDNPQGIENEDGKRTEWVWVKTLPANATQETLWNFAPKPIIWAHWGEDGTDGDGVEYIFYKSTEKSQNDTLPVNMKPVKKEDLTNDIQRTIFNIDDFYPGPGWFTESPVNNKQKAIDALTAAGLYDSETFNTAWNNKFGIPIVGDANGPYWTDNPYSPDKAYPFVWVSIRKSHPNSKGEREWGDFGEPSVWTSYNLKSRIFIVYCNVDEETVPPTPTGGWWDGTDDGGLTINKPDYELLEPWTDRDIDTPGKIAYLSSGLFLENGHNVYWSAPFRMTGAEGKKGADGSNIEFVYALSELEPQFPAYDGTNESYTNVINFFNKVEGALTDSDPEHDGYVYTENGKSTEWFDHPQGIADVDGKRKEWVWSRSLPADSSTWVFPERPVIWAHWGEDGTDGDGVEYIFSLGTSPDYTMTESAWNSLWNTFNTDTAKAVYSMDDFVPNASWFTPEHYDQVSAVMTGNGKTISSTDWESLKNDIMSTFNNSEWTDNPSSVTAQKQYQYVSIRKFSDNAWQPFSYPQVWANYSVSQFDAFAFVAVPSGVDLTNYQPTGGSFSSPIPADDSTTFPGITLNWTDGPEPTSRFDVIWMTTGRASEKTPNTILWTKPKEMSDSFDFQVEWSTNIRAVADLNVINSALANAIEGGYTLEGKTYNSYDFGEFLSKNSNNESAAEDAWRNVVRAKLGIEFSDNSAQSCLMATCQLKNGQWTHWVINRVKGEQGEPGRSLNVLGRISYELYLDDNNYTKSAAEAKLSQDAPSNPQDGEMLIVFPKDPNESNIYIGDTTSGLGGALYMWKYSGTTHSWVDINGTDNGESPNNTYTSPNGHLILWDGDTWQDVGNVVGPEGPMSKIAIAFADDDPNDPTKKIHVDGDDIPLAKWIGFLTYNEKNESEQPINPINVNAPGWVWSYFKGQDGYGYEFIYKSTSTKSAPAVPNDNAWHNQPNVVPTSLGWVDDPIEPDATNNKYVWMCWRKFDHGANEWTDFAGKPGTSVARLWQVYANSIDEVYEYFHADQNISPSFPGTGYVAPQADLPAGFLDFWHSKSEVIGDSATTYKWDSTNRYLFNIEVVRYSDGSAQIMEPHYISVYADNIKDIVDYYIRSTNGSSAPRMSGNTPITTSQSGYTTEGTSYWTTNVSKTTLTTTYKYLWNISKRIYENGDEEWSTPMVIGVYGIGSNGDDAVYLDIDNEMDTIQIDGSRKILVGKTCEAIIHMYKGRSVADIWKLEVAGEEGFGSNFAICTRSSETGTWSNPISNPSSATFSSTVTALKMVLTLNENTTLPSEYSKIQFTITSEDNDVRMISYTLAGTTNPSIYSIHLSSDVIIKKANGTYMPNPLTVEVVKITGKKRDVYTSNQTGEGGFTLSLNGTAVNDYNNITVTSYNIGAKLTFSLKVDTNDSDTTIDTVMDVENVYVIGEGQGYDDDWLKKVLGGTTSISGALIMTGDLLVHNEDDEITGGVMGYDYNIGDLYTDVRFFAGNTHISDLTTSNAATFISSVEQQPFRVTEAGKLYATDAVISGSITATQLTIAGSTLASTSDVSNWINSFVDIPSVSVSEYDDRWLTKAFEKSNVSGGLITTGNILLKDSNSRITSGIMGYNTNANDIKIFAGTSFLNENAIMTSISDAPFRVYENGHVVMKDVEIASNGGSYATFDENGISLKAVKSVSITNDDDGYTYSGSNIEKNTRITGNSFEIKVADGSKLYKNGNTSSDSIDISGNAIYIEIMDELYNHGNSEFGTKLYGVPTLCMKYTNPSTGEQKTYILDPSSWITNTGNLGNMYWVTNYKLLPYSFNTSYVTSQNTYKNVSGGSSNTTSSPTLNSLISIAGDYYIFRPDGNILSESNEISLCRFHVEDIGSNAASNRGLIGSANLASNTTTVETINDTGRYGYSTTIGDYIDLPAGMKCEITSTNCSTFSGFIVSSTNNATSYINQKGESAQMKNGLQLSNQFTHGGSGVNSTISNNDECGFNKIYEFMLYAAGGDDPMSPGSNWVYQGNSQNYIIRGLYGLFPYSTNNITVNANNIIGKSYSLVVNYYPAYGISNYNPGTSANVILVKCHAEVSGRYDSPQPQIEPSPQIDNYTDIRVAETQLTLDFNFMLKVNTAITRENMVSKIKQFLKNFTYDKTNLKSTMVKFFGRIGSPTLSTSFDKTTF